MTKKWAVQVSSTGAVGSKSAPNVLLTAVNVSAYEPAVTPSKRFVIVVACGALLVALSGTGYAAVQALPRNSVTTVQVKDTAWPACDLPGLEVREPRPCDHEGR